MEAEIEVVKTLAVTLALLGFDVVRFVRSSGMVFSAFLVSLFVGVVAHLRWYRQKNERLTGPIPGYSRVPATQIVLQPDDGARWHTLFVETLNIVGRSRVYLTVETTSQSPDLSFMHGLAADVMERTSADVVIVETTGTSFDSVIVSHDGLGWDGQS